MVFYQVDPTAIPDLDNSTRCSTNTPPETIAADILDDDPFNPDPNSSVPWPGSTFIIRAASSGHVLTLIEGQVSLAPPGGRGSIHWVCIDTKGWLGFQNPVSNRFLGHDKNGRLCCSAVRHLGWENFCVRMRPRGGYVLLMMHWERLWQVGVVGERGEERLAKVENGEEDGIVWEFVKV